MTTNEHRIDRMVRLIAIVGIPLMLLLTAVMLGFVVNIGVEQSRIETRRADAAEQRLEKAEARAEATRQRVDAVLSELQEPSQGPSRVETFRRVERIEQRLNDIDDDLAEIRKAVEADEPDEDGEG